jgi:hypothetical protein
MAEKGIIKLGTYAEAVAGTMRSYMLEGGVGRGRKKFLVNPQAPKLAGGDQRLEDQENWSYFTMVDWQAGMGRRDPEAGGFFDADADTRVPGQFICPPQWRTISTRARAGTYSDVRNDFYGETSETRFTLDPLGAVTDFDALAVKVNRASGSISILWFLVRYVGTSHDVGETVTLNGGLLEDSVGEPGNELRGGSGAYVISPQWTWAYVALTSAYDLAGTGDTFWVHLSPADNTVALEILSAGYLLTTSVTKVKDASSQAWANASQQKTPYFLTDLDCPAGSAQCMVEFNGYLYAAWGSKLYKASAIGSTGLTDFSASNDRTSTITGLTVWGSVLYVAYGTAKLVDTMSTADVFTATDFYADRFYPEWGQGYLYFSLQNDIYYAGDPTPNLLADYEGPIPVGPDQYNIRGAAGDSGGAFYMATDSGLYTLAPGDIVQKLAFFSAPSAYNGVGMIGHQGEVFIPADQGVYRFGQEGRLLNIYNIYRSQVPGYQRYDNVPRIIALASMNNWLVAVTNGGPEPAYHVPSVMAWQGDGWHSVALLPRNSQTASVLYARGYQELCVGGRHVYAINMPDFAINPVSSAEATFCPVGWLETDWFDGRLLTLYKDMDGIQVLGRFFGDYNNPDPAVSTYNNRVDVYWQDDGSSGRWELLGSTEDSSDPTLFHHTIRWEDRTTRPATKRIRLAFLLRSSHVRNTPVVEKIALRFRVNTKDRYGWNLRILTTLKEPDIAGAPLDDYTPAQQRAHLEALQRQTAPFVMLDIDGNYREVTMQAASMDAMNYRYDIQGDDVHYDEVFNWTIEEVEPGPYVVPAS